MGNSSALAVASKELMPQTWATRLENGLGLDLADPIDRLIDTFEKFSHDPIDASSARKMLKECEGSDSQKFDGCLLNSARDFLVKRSTAFLLKTQCDEANESIFANSTEHGCQKFVNSEMSPQTLSTEQAETYVKINELRIEVHGIIDALFDLMASEGRGIGQIKKDAMAKVDKLATLASSLTPERAVKLFESRSPRILSLAVVQEAKLFYVDQNRVLNWELKILPTTIEDYIHKLNGGNTAAETILAFVLAPFRQNLYQDKKQNRDLIQTVHAFYGELEKGLAKVYTLPNPPQKVVDTMDALQAAFLLFDGILYEDKESFLKKLKGLNQSKSESAKDITDEIIGEWKSMVRDEILKMAIVAPQTFIPKDEIIKIIHQQAVLLARRSLSDVVRANPDSDMTAIVKLRRTADFLRLSYLRMYEPGKFGPSEKMYWEVELNN